MPLTILVRRQPPGRAGVAVLGAAILFLASMGASRLPVGSPGPAGTGSPIPPVVIEKGDFRFACDARGVSLLANPRDPFKATLMPRAGQRSGPPPVLGLALSYRTDPQGAWSEIAARGPGVDGLARSRHGHVCRAADRGAPVEVVETYRTDGRVLDWTVEIASAADVPVEVGDLAISIPAAGPYGEDPAQIFERGFLRHQFVSGAASFLYFVRASGSPPYLLVTCLPGTKLEYFDGSGRAGGRLFVHSARSGPAETRGTWRQPHTSLELAPAGKPGGRAAYGFRFRWAESYDEIRAFLYDEGLFDVRVIPGMTVPEDLAVRFSLHTKARIERIEAEHPGANDGPAARRARRRPSCL